MVEFSDERLPACSLSDFLPALPSHLTTISVSRPATVNHSCSTIASQALNTMLPQNSQHQQSRPSPSHSEQSRCSGCGEAIMDRFYLYALDRQWHNVCLRCSMCRVELEGQGSCYVKDGLIYCKEDYLRRFGVQKCLRCCNTIQPGEMVMKAQAQIYHVHCFTCSICNSVLQTGDHFGVIESKIYCRAHFEQLQYNIINTLPIVPSSQCNGISTVSNSNNISPNSTFSSTCAALQSTCSPESVSALSLSPPMPNPLTSTANLLHDDLNYVVDTHFHPPLSHVDFAAPPTDGNSPMKNRQRKKMKQADSPSHRMRDQWPLGISLMDPESLFQSQQPVKQKRMRTSFKHHQLRIMKQYFNLNHNPDAKDLKQLSQKTGLSKRVLQVWFQNARAKFRRGVGGKDGLTEGGENSPSADDQNSNDEMISESESQNDLNDTESKEELKTLQLDDVESKDNLKMDLNGTNHLTPEQPSANLANQIMSGEAILAN